MTTIVVDLEVVAPPIFEIEVAVAGVSGPSGVGLNPGDLAVRYDTVQPEVNCLWISPEGAIILITES